MESAAQSIVGNAVQLLGEEYQLLRGVGGQVGELRNDLEVINALLVMQSEAEDGAVDRFVQVCMKQLRELGYDAEDCIDLYKLRIKCRHGGVRAWLKHHLKTLLERRRLAGEISALYARALAIGERQARYGVNREALRRSPMLLPAPMPAPASAPAHANDGDRHRLVGIEEQAEALVERLKARAQDGGGKLQVFSIVGFGGLGKTTLAMEVCRRLEADFPYQAMVSVSQAFQPGRDLDTLLKNVLRQVVNPKTGNEKGIREEGELGNIAGSTEEEKLKQYLKDKRYLIVIDDVWTIQTWEVIQCLLQENNLGSRIIVTTRIDTVAKACSTASASGEYIHCMERLKDVHSQELFLSRAFGSNRCPDELRVPMENILRKCGGLPLAIVSIASVLVGYTSPGSKDKWETIYKSIGSHMESNPTLEGMRQIITLSYNHLPHVLKGCMMYLSIFPEDFEIDRDRLLRRWIAEGLIPEKRGLTLMEVAESYLDELVSRNMVVPCFDFNGMVESCRVHDMLLEVMVSTSLECNFVSLLGGQYAGMSYDRIRRLSIQGGDDRRPQGAEQHKKKKNKAERGIQGIDLEHVRSLSMFKLQDHELLGHLGKFTLLRVLDLEGCEGGVTDKHMGYICRLYLLRFLNLRYTNVSTMPREIGNLEHLETLDVYHTYLQDLPETVTKLEKLERLQFATRCDWTGMWKLPRGLSRMKALREVHFARLRDDIEVARELGDLQQLQTLCMYIECSDDSEALTALATSLSKIYSFRSLNIAHMNIHNGNMHFLYTLPNPPQLLRSLRIEGFLANGLPSWVGSLTHLVHIDIMRTKFTSDDQIFGVLCNAPNLKKIGMDNFSYIGNKLVARSTHNFPSLMHLHVVDVGCPKVLEFEKGSMPKVEGLLIRFSHNPKSIVGIEHLTNLKEVQLKGPKDSNALHRALDQLKNMSQLQVVVKYE
ncbi:hypothetical protein ACP70R_015368 [Stipagrostis hirtigluma subsp. patula]